MTILNKTFIEIQTTTKDDEIRIHLGANSRPISFEYYTENQGTQQTTSATYYYHYDLHGNVIRVTNSSGTTVISYTYDQLGTIVSQTNSSNIYNPFTYMGEVQVIHDDEFDTSGSTPKTGLYSSGSGYYNPHTGTFLGGSGAPASANPTSTSAEEPTAQSTAPVSQSISSSGSAESPESTSSDAPGTSFDAQPEDPLDGLTQGGLLTEDSTPTTGDDMSKYLFEAPMPMKDPFHRDNDDNAPEKQKRSSGKCYGGMGHDVGFERTDPSPGRDIDPGIDDGRPKFELSDINLDDNPFARLDKMVDAGFLRVATPDANDPATDNNSSDDFSQYNWVHRDKNGNITACQKNNGDTYIYPTDKDGNRTGTNRLTNPDKMAESWKNICNSIESGKQGNMKFYNNNGDENPTGYAAMNVGDGKWWVIYNGYNGPGEAEGVAHGTAIPKHNIIKKGMTDKDVGFKGNDNTYKNGKGTVITYILNSGGDEVPNWTKTYYNPSNKEKYHKWDIVFGDPKHYHEDGDGMESHWWFGKPGKCPCGHHDDEKP